jgi:hypothetical protein
MARVVEGEGDSRRRRGTLEGAEKIELEEIGRVIRREAGSLDWVPLKSKVPILMKMPNLQ